MRLLHATLNDMLYQAKYGFYLLYAFMSVLYVGILFLLPEQYKSISTSIILLTDPAMLGFFFIGGIWLLEKGEGLHKFYGVSPLKPMEYIFAKALSLAVISALAAFCIVLIGIRSPVNLPMLIIGVFLGSGIFTMLGLTIATYARSVNHYMIISVPVEIILMVPPLLTAFGITHRVLEFLPGTVLWRIIALSLDEQAKSSFLILLAGLLAWLGIALLIALLRVPAILQADGGEKA